MLFRRGGAYIATLARCAERQGLAKRHKSTRAARHASPIFNSFSYSGEGLRFLNARAVIARRCRTCVPAWPDDSRRLRRPLLIGSRQWVVVSG